MNSPLEYFYDPVLKAPTIGCMLMSLSAALVGVITFLRKQSLVGETLSHCAYPGVICGMVFAAFLTNEDPSDTFLSLTIMGGAFCTALLGLFTIYFLEQRWRIPSDAALCFVLSAYFGVGVTLASRVQFSHSSLYNQIQVYLYGQAATMTDQHIVIYALLSCFVIAVMAIFLKEIQAITFDRNYATSIGVKTQFVDILTFILIVLAVVIGIRSVGVILMSAMLIAPPAAARQFTNKLGRMLILAAIFGMLSGFFGNYFSVELNRLLAVAYPEERLSLPTGPMIVVVATIICLFSLLFAPERGLLLRLLRIAKFRYKCLCENLLKAMWRLGPDATLPFDEISKYQGVPHLYLRFILLRLVINGWVDQVDQNCFRLSKEGKQWAAQIVRLHRLWEVYLANYLGVGAEKVHRNAEEMEHIITPEIEQELTLLLQDPKMDPHHQPIPPRDSL